MRSILRGQCVWRVRMRSSTLCILGQNSLAYSTAHSCKLTPRNCVAPRCSLIHRWKELKQSFPAPYQRAYGRHTVASGWRSRIKVRRTSLGSTYWRCLIAVYPVRPVIFIVRHFPGSSTPRDPARAHAPPMGSPTISYDLLRDPMTSDEILRDLTTGLPGRALEPPSLLEMQSSPARRHCTASPPETPGKELSWLGTYHMLPAITTTHCLPLTTWKKPAGQPAHIACSGSEANVPAAQLVGRAAPSEEAEPGRQASH